ncbi:DUF222 domain-containing protein, partial [Occultella aeris]|uniref:DUF222 domain-containing protein n=1 Tax=Occultella aeris TaxID=2761496 RepID=UPI003B42CADC
MDDTTTTTGGPGNGAGGASGGPGGGGPSPAGVALASRMHLSLADLMAGSLEDQLIAMDALTSSIAAGDPIEESDRYGTRFLGQAALRAHVFTERLTGAKLDWMGIEEEAGVWDTSKGFRTYPHYVAKTYGICASSARRLVNLAKGLRNGLPATRKWLRSGQIGVEQAQILLKATSTPAAVDGLQYPATPTNPADGGTDPTEATATKATADTEVTAETGATAETEATAETGAIAETEAIEGVGTAAGTADSADAAGGTGTAGTGGAVGRVQTVEEFLLDNAATRSPEDLRRLVDHFVAIVDPDATDKAHRAAAGREFLNIDRTMDGYHVAGFLTLELGQYVRTALEAIMGKPAADETRTSSQRRAQALGDLAHMVLDQGKVGTSGSVRPHLGVLISYPEFLDLIKTTETSQTTVTSQTTEPRQPTAPPPP